MRRGWLALLLVIPGCGPIQATVCEPGRVEACACVGGYDGAQTCDDDGSRWGPCDCETDGTTPPPDTTPPSGGCPSVELSVSTAAYMPDFNDIHLFFHTGLTQQPQYLCFTTGSELYFDSRIELSIPDGALVATLPDDYFGNPAPLEEDPIREDASTGEPLTFGDGFQVSEIDADLTSVLAQNPTLDGFVRLCNRDEECDELVFTLTTI